MIHLWPKWYPKAALAMLAMLAIVACTKAPPTRQLPETPQELRSYPSPVPDYNIVYEHPEDLWRISIPAGWAVSNDYRREGYSSTEMLDPSGDWELTITREDVSDWIDFYQEGDTRNWDSYGAAASHLASAKEWDVDKRVREVIFLGAEDITIKGYAAYLAEYLWIPDDGGIVENGHETSWVQALIFMVGADEIEVSLHGPPDRMLAKRADIRDMLLSFEPPDVAPSPVASPTQWCTARDAVIASDVRGESERNVYEGKVRSVTVTVIGTVTNTCNNSVDFNLLSAVYDRNGAILETSGISYQYHQWGWNPKTQSWNPAMRLPNRVFSLAPGWTEPVRFDVWLSPEEFDRVTSVAILVMPH